jgi:L-fuculose-phosphate aldolase
MIAYGTLSPMRSLENERAALVAAGRELAAAGLVTGGAGNLSVRDGDRVAITAAGARLDAIEGDAVVVVDLDGTLLEGEAGREPTSELDLHLELYRRSDVAAVVHSHPPVASALAAVVEEVPPVHYEMARLGGAVPVAPYARFGTAELARAVADTLGPRPAALMANHGAIVQAASLDEALELTHLLEWTCSVYWRAQAVGRPRALTREQVAELGDAFADRRARGL